MLSTYRLQFHKGFTFVDAVAIIPYLHQLGITHVYASPYLKAVAGSTHGYDVVDHSQLNPEIGSEADYQLFVQTLSIHGMSHILDTVPNHMGVETNDNKWWNDVLAHGQQSQFANYFDIDWSGFSSRPEMVGKVLLPVLGETLGQAIAGESLQIKSDESGPCVMYYDRRFPVTGAGEGENLNELLSRQAYRLSYWRTANDEINYRRFFDITGLAGLQMQRLEVFDAAHDFTFRLIAQGCVTGLRVDHPDGLLDPKEYFDRLQAMFAKNCPAQAADGKPLYVSVEKILNGDELLREDWAVAGTSGYDFLCQVNNLFVDRPNEPAMSKLYENFIGDSRPYEELVYDKKRLLLDTSFSNDLTSLANRLDALAQSEVSSQDFTRRQLRESLREIVACFPLYRSYVSARGAAEADVAVVTFAADKGKSRNPQIEPSAIDFVRDSILLQYRVSPAMKMVQMEFAQRFQQLTSPVNAKGIEDTAFYIYNRLVSLNEVGGDPGRFGRDIDELHRYFQDRQRRWPLAMSPLSTHDTKRSEDVRARLNVLSEMPGEWEQLLQRWRTLNTPITDDVHPNDQYLLYQILLGAWPLEPLDAAGQQVLTKRIVAYMQKALREAKVRSSWVAVNEKYEAAVTGLVTDLIDPEKSEKFLESFLPFMKRVSAIGLINSIAQTVLRLTSSGICDTYQGTELWDFSLVDPDNRRPVDYRARGEMMRALDQAAQQDHPRLIREIVSQMQDGRIKLWITRQLLQLRCQLPDLFSNGDYQPLPTQGEHAKKVFAFMRTAGDRYMIVIVPRLIASLTGDHGWKDLPWGDTCAVLPSAIQVPRLRNVLSNREITVAGDSSLPISQALADFPAAILIPTGKIKV